MKLIVQLLAESWRSVTTAAILGGASGAAQVSLLAIIHRVLKSGPEAQSTLLWWFAAVCALTLVTRVASQLFLTRMSQNSVSRLRMGLCRRILDSPLRQLEEIGMARIINTLTTDVLMINQALNAFPTLLVNVVILLCGAVYLGILSPTILVAATLFAILGAASYFGTSRFARRYWVAGREAQDVLLRHVRQMVNGVKSLKLHHPKRRDFVESLLTPAERSVRENQFLSFCIQDAAVVWGRLLFLIAIGLLLFAWPRYADVEMGTLAGYTLAIFYLMSPIERIVAWLPLMSRAMISVEKIQRLGLKLHEAESHLDQVTPLPAWRTIELAGITHQYFREGHTSGFLLGPIDLTFHAGEIVFIVGGNGSGKTTLMKLVTGLYLPADGRILLDGQPIDAENRESYRQLFAAVFDDAMIFDGLLGVGSGDRDAQARRYLAELRLEHVVQVEDGKFSTTDVSRGQRKRLALLTAYLEDRSIYVFDEWAADQDPTFKKVFYEELLPDLKRRGKTVVAITHDDRYFAVADRLVKLEEGRVTDGAALLT
jgi:putative ATP-binding cassette transporter